MPEVTDAKADWIERVLGITVRIAGGAAAASPASAPPSWHDARANWQAANATVDTQIAALQAVLRRSEDEVLEEIAEFGLNAVTGNHRVRLAAALMEVGAGDPATLRKSAPKVLQLVEEFRRYLASSEAVEVCDANPFGTPVAIRSTLGPALAQMAAALAATARS